MGSRDKIRSRTNDSESLKNAAPVPLTYSDLFNRFTPARISMPSYVTMRGAVIPVKFTLPPSAADADARNITPNFEGDPGDMVFILEVDDNISCNSLYAGIKIASGISFPGYALDDALLQSDVNVGNWTRVKEDNLPQVNRLLGDYVCTPIIRSTSCYITAQDEYHPRHLMTTYDFAVLAQLHNDKKSFIRIEAGDTLVTLAGGNRCVITKDGKIIANKEDCIDMRSKVITTSTSISASLDHAMSTPLGSVKPTANKPAPKNKKRK